MRLWCVCALSFSVSFHWSWLKAPWTPEAAELGVWLKNWVKGAFTDGSCDAWRNNNYKTKQLEIRLIRSADRHWSIWTQNIGRPDRHSSLALTWYGTGTGYWYLVNSVQQSGSQRLSASQCTVTHSHSHCTIFSIRFQFQSNQILNFQPASNDSSQKWKLKTTRSLTLPLSQLLPRDLFSQNSL